MNVRHYLIGSVVLALSASATGAGFGEEPVSEFQPKFLDPVVVTASKLPSPLSQVGSSVTVITSGDLENRGIQSVADALQLVPGLDVINTGGPGQMTEVYTRGADSGRTLVMLNGVVVNDAINAGRSADLGRMTVDNVERIEVLRGPQSAVYGSGAMGGVINIITKRGAKDWEASADLSGGKYNTWIGVASAAGSYHNLDLSLGASWDYSQGFSAAKRTQAYPDSLPDMAPNAHRNWTADLGVGCDFSPEWNGRLTYRSVQGLSQLDYGGGDANAAEDYSSASQHQLALAESSYRVLPGWRQTVRAGLSQLDRTLRNVAQPGGAAAQSDYHGRNVDVSWNNQVDIPVAWSSLAAGVHYRQEQGRVDDPQYSSFPERSNHQFGYFLENQVRQWGVTLDAAARWDVHDQFGTWFTYRLAPVYSFERTGTTLKGTWGTGFNSPSLYQLYSSYGDINLRPEKSSGWDAGVEQKIGDQVKAGITYFQNDFENQINIDFATWQYVNLMVQTKGWEVFAAAMPVRDLTLQIGYTKLTANDRTHFETRGVVPLARRADYRLTLDAGYQWRGARLHLGVRHVGPRWEDDFSRTDSATGYPVRVAVPAYTVADLLLGYAPHPAAEFYVKINNLLDTDYVEALGYNTPRFGVFSGVKLAWK